VITAIEPWNVFTGETRLPSNSQAPTGAPDPA
jgi:hypothetical protein